MCDQTEVSYQPGNVVWVKLNPVWWPGIVADSEEIPPEILKTLRKTPIAIVKFFQETEVFEYVHKLSNIYHYNCLRKNDFIRKGLDMYRSKNRDAPSHMKLFPADVARAEVLTGGDPNILNDEIFQPEEKPTYADLFANSKKSPKKIKPSIRKKSSTQVASQKSAVQRIITHPRFIKLNSGLETDYEVRERKQEPVRAECDEEDNSPPTTYRCQDCDFTTIRLNVIVLHNKSHTRNYAKPAPSKASKRKNISVRVQERSYVTSERESLQKAEAVSSKISETNGTVLKTRKKGRPKKSVESSTPTALSVTAKTKEEKTKTAPSRPSISKPKRSSPQKDAIQQSLLEDWAEFETEQDNLENGDASLGSSTAETEDISTRDEKTVNESYSASKKDEFDFDDTEEQLVIDKSKIRAGRKIPRVLEEKSEEVEKIETESVKKRKTSGVRGKHEDARIEIHEDESKHSGVEHPKRRRGSKQEESRTKIQEDVYRNTANENVRKRRTSSGLRRKSEDTKTESHQELEKDSKSTDVKRRKLSRTEKITEKEVKVEEETKIADLTGRKDSRTERKDEVEDIVEVKVEEGEVEVPRIEETSTEVEIEEMHEEIEVGGEIEIETENTMDDEQVFPADVPLSHVEKTENDSNEKEAAELSQKVDELLQEVSVSSKLPELPQSLKKKHIQSHNTDLTEPDADDDDDQIIESISLINDDSSDGFEEKKPTSFKSNRKGITDAHVEKKRKSSDETKNSASETADISSIDDIEVNSDSSPEIVSVEMPPTPRSKGFTKKLPIVIPSTTIAPGKRPPVRFTMMSKLKNINQNPMLKRSPGPLVSENTAKIFKTVHQQKLQQSRARSQLKQGKSINARHMVRTPTLGQQAAINTSRSTPKSNSNKLMVMKPMSTQRPTTIDNIDLTVSKDPIITSVSSGQISGTPRPTRPNYSRTTAGRMPMNKGTPKNVVVSSLVHLPRSGTSTGKLVSSSDDAIPSQNQSEIITVNDDLDCANDNVQVEEINYIVDEAGNCIAESENACSTSKKEDILAKALQDTDVLQTEITSPSSSTILLESCDIVQNSSSTTVYENVTLNTPPIMSSFETPSRTNNSSNPISEISEFIIISDADNIQ